jgi:hypothetical protein
MDGWSPVIHQIGGQYGTNKNTTQRSLLLLESCPIGRRTEAYERVLRGVINRYLEEDVHPLTRDSKTYRVPRFLLNDIVRFWRTMAVDFASKQRDRAGEGWGLRNAKLRMSRKLIFASGMLVCFSPKLDSELNDQISTDKDAIKRKLVNHLRDRLRLTPLQILAKSIEQYGVPDATAKELFGAYREFLGLLDGEKSRNALKALRACDSRTDATFGKVRDISRTFEILKRLGSHLVRESKCGATPSKVWGLLMRNIGFSTGALARSDFRAALHMLAGKDGSAVELSALGRKSSLRLRANWIIWIWATLSTSRFMHQVQWNPPLRRLLCDSLNRLRFVDGQSLNHCASRRHV